MKAPVSPAALSRALTEALEPRRLLAALVSGTSVDGGIGSTGEVDTYTISVGPNQRFMIVALGKTGGSSSFTPRGQIIPPAGSGDATTTFVGATSRSIASSSSTRTYTIKVNDVGDDAVGNYRLTAFVSNGAQADDDSNDFSDTTDNVSANSGQRSAATADIGDLDVWRLDAKKGQAITVTVVENDAGDPVDPAVWIVDAAGRLVGFQTDDVGTRLEFTATDTGAYYAVVADGSSDTAGVYGIAFTRVPGAQYTGDPDTGTLSPGVTRTGDLPAGDADVFSVYLTPGQRMDLTVNRGNTGSLNPRVVLYDPAGKNVASDASGTSASVAKTASIGGTYYVAIWDQESDGGGTYTIEYTLAGGLGGNGTAPANGRVRIDTDDNDDAITVRRRSVSGVDTLEVILNGSTKSYYAPEVSQLALYTAGGDDNVTMSGSNIRTYVSAGDGDDTIVGTTANDSLTGGAGRNRLFGGDGDDRLNGSNGRDILNGEGGNDRLYGQGGGDLLDGGGNNDRLFGGDGDDEILGGNGIDKLYGNAGNDTLTGGRGKDNLRGDTGDDLFRTGDGERDELSGGDGFDSIANLDFDDDKDILSSIEGVPTID